MGMKFFAKSSLRQQKLPPTSEHDSTWRSGGKHSIVAGMRLSHTNRRECLAQAWLSSAKEMSYFPRSSCLVARDVLPPTYAHTYIQTATHTQNAQRCVRQARCDSLTANLPAKNPVACLQTARAHDRDVEGFSWAARRAWVRESARTKARCNLRSPHCIWHDPKLPTK